MKKIQRRYYLTDGRYVRVVVRLVAEPVHQTRLADVRVAQHEHLVRFAGVHVARASAHAGPSTGRVGGGDGSGVPPTIGRKNRRR